MSREKPVWCSLVVVGLIVALGAAVAAPGAEDPGAKTPPAVTPELIAQGKGLYARECADCHGVEGKGDGAAAYLLYPKPRDFVKSEYRIVSTWDRLPTDDDLFNTITRGMPGSSMPPWDRLSERERWSLVYYLKSLSDRPWPGRATADPSGQERKGLIAIPPKPNYDDAARKEAARLYAEGCASCHGATGKGDGQQKQIDQEGFPTRPRDLTLGIYKGTPTEEEVFRRIVAGLPGTPMPMSDWAYGDPAWLLTNYVLEMSSEEQRENVVARRQRITAVRRKHIPDHPDSADWRGAEPVELVTMPLWWRDDFAHRITVRALHDGKDLAIQLTWNDATHDHTAIRPQDFRDAAAVQLTASASPPFLGMGGPTSAVNIWMWKSERQADLETAFQDIEATYPNIGTDSYPNLMRSALEQPTRHALTLESDPTFVTGWGAGNIVADPTYRRAAESLEARGFGSLKVRPLVDQNVAAQGIHGSSAYSVTFKRSLAPKGSDKLALKPGGTYSAAFAVWDGSAGDRDGKKCVTIWHELTLQP